MSMIFRRFSGNVIILKEPINTYSMKHLLYFDDI